MSILRCDNCDKNIDTDSNAEHFEECKEEAMTNELKEVQDILQAFEKWVLNNVDHGIYIPLSPPEPVNAILALINQKEKEARIDELKLMPHEKKPELHGFTQYSDLEECRCYKARRIKQLKEELKGGTQNE